MATGQDAAQHAVEAAVAPSAWQTASRWRDEFRAQLATTSRDDRWGRVLMAIGVVHLAIFAFGQWLSDPRLESDPRQLLLWCGDLIAAWAVLRIVAGKGWYSGGSAAGVVLRVWVTFFILAFNTVLMNAQSGWSIHWYRLAWPTLSTFGFATMAWLVDSRFLIPAVQMWLTGLIIVRFPQCPYAIYGVSWCAALVGLGVVLERGRRFAPSGSRNSLQRSTQQ